jgi:hypothetical protein
MATATITYLSDRKVGSVVSLKYPKATLAQVKYSNIQASEILPFRIQFTNTQIQGYDVNNPPPIGIAVIGINNYIL